MSLSLRIFIGLLLLIAAALWVSVQNIRQELVPGMRQSLEEVLVDTANLLAVVVQEEVLAGEISDGDFAGQMAAFDRRRLNAVIYNLQKRDPSMIVYITDARGIVVFDSRGRDLGSDYSRWNDVYRTLSGEYGARSTREDPADDGSSVMYVAAPVFAGGKLIGVLSVGKPSMVVMPFVDAARRALWVKSAWLLLLSLVLVALLSFELTRSVRKLTRFADAVQISRRVTPPVVHERELAKLAQAMESMRVKLEGKRYVEQYLHALTHELKSPLAAIEGAAELLDEELPAESRQRFVKNIRAESGRLHQVVERLLRLSAIESRTGLEEARACSTRSIVLEACDERMARMAANELTWSTDEVEEVTVIGEPFLLQLAIGNLLDNAIEFSPKNSAIRLTGRVRDDLWTLTIRDGGPGIPDYARERIFERFYSLPRHDGGPKSTGLGLAAVREVVQLHGGEISVENHPEGGAVATLTLPLRQPS